MLTNKKLSVVISCYNDGGSIRAMYQRLKTVLDRITLDWEIIYVNDASPDNAEQILKLLSQEDERVTVITHTRNFGLQAVFISGIEGATGDAITLIEGDIQDPPEMIEDFVKKWLEGYEVVYGIRADRDEGFLKRYAFKLFYRFFHKLSYISVPVDAGDFCLLDGRVARTIADMPEKDMFIRGLRAWVGFKQIGIPYKRSARFSGESTNSFFSYTRWARKAIFSFSYAPLELVSILAFVLVILSILSIFFYAGIAIMNPQGPRGFATIIVVVFFLSGMQLLVLSIIGEYLGRIFEEVKNRPKYIVKYTINSHKNLKKSKKQKTTDGRNRLLE